MSRRRSFLYKVGESVPATFFKPEDLPADNMVYGLFETKKGNQYLVPASDVIAEYFTGYTFIAPVIAYERPNGGYAVFLMNKGVVSGRYRTVTAGAVITPGVLAPSTTALSINDFMGKANAVQTRMYYVNAAGRVETELDIYLKCKDIILNGQECYPASMGELNAIRLLLTDINKINTLAGIAAISTTASFNSYTISGSTSSYIWRFSSFGSGTAQISTSTKNTTANFMALAELDVKFNNPEIKPSYMDIDPVNLTSYLWVEDEEGWWTAPKINVSSGNSSLRFNISNQYAGSRIRVYVEFESLTAAALTLYALNAGTTYLNIAERTTPVYISYDYVLPTVTDTAYFNVGYRRTSSAADVNNVRIRVEQIDSQAEPQPAVTITQQGDWALQDGWFKSPPIAVNQFNEQRILITTGKNNQTVRIKAYTEGGHYSYDYISIGRLDEEWNAAGGWTAKIMQSDYTERLPYIIDMVIPTKGDHFIVIRQSSGTGESFGYFTIEDAKGLDPIPALDYYVEGDWTLNSDGYYESPAIGHSGKTVATIRGLNRTGTRIDAVLKYYVSSESEDYLNIGYDNNNSTTSPTDSISGTEYSADNPKISSFRILANSKAFKHIWYEKNWTGTAGTDKGYFKIE